MCEVAQRFASWLGLRESIPAALEYVFARWDGRGFPALAGEEIPLSARLLHVARDASLFVSAFGAERARAVLEDRSGAAYDPRLAELAARNLDEMLAGRAPAPRRPARTGRVVEPRLLRPDMLLHRSHFPSASARSPARSSGPRAAGSKKRTPT